MPSNDSEPSPLHLHPQGFLTQGSLTQRPFAQRPLALFLLCVCLLLLAACGRGEDPTPVPQATATVAAAALPTEVPATEVPPTEIPPTEIPPTEIPPTDTPVEAPTAFPLPTSAPLTQTLPVVVAVNAQFPPFVFRDEAGTLTGFDVELMRALGQAANLEIQFLGMPFEGLLNNALAPGELDAGISAITVTEARRSLVDFTNSYLLSGQGLAVRADESRIQGVADLNEDTRVGVKTSTTGEAYARANISAQLLFYDESLLLVEALLLGEIDAVILDGPVLAAEEAKGLGLRLLVRGLTDEPYAIAVNRARPDVLERLNLALDQVQADGVYDALIDRWFGEVYVPRE